MHARIKGIIIMSEDLKFIVTELIKRLKKNFTLLSFKALHGSDLLQVLSDLLSDITQDGQKVDLRDETLEQTSIRLLSVLRVLKYQPNKDPALFRQRLIKGDPETIYTILQWLLSNVDVARQRAYLARFLVKVEVPQEYLGDSDTAALYDRYINLVEEFKIVHKEREAGRKGGEAAAELKADLKAMEKEREVIIDRIEKIKVRTESNAHLLKAAKALRIERDRERDLASQKIHEKEAIKNLQTSLQRAERKLQNIRETGVELTPQAIIQRLTEEVMVLNAIRNERLPAELSSLKSRVEVLSSVANSSYIGPDEIVNLRQKLDSVAREVQALAETRVTDIGTDKMAPFRQQAAAITSVKRNTLERLESTEIALNDLTTKLEEKREIAKRFAEDSVPRGEELKRYVARLKSKSVVYKRCRSELAGLRAENGVLNRTIVIIENSLALCKPIGGKNNKNLPDNYTAGNAASINAQLSRNISSFRSQLAPLLNELQPLRQKSQELDERYEIAKRSHNSVDASMQNTTSALSNEVITLRETVTNDSLECERLRNDIEKLKIAQEKIQQEIRSYASPRVGQSLREKLNDEIIAEEKKFHTLKEEEKFVKEYTVKNAHQIQQWTNLTKIFESKLQYAEEIKRRDGIVVRGEGAETLILQ